MKSKMFEFLCKKGLLNALSDEKIIYLLKKFRDDNRKIIWNNISNDRMKNILFALEERAFRYFWDYDLKGQQIACWKSLNKDERITLWKKLSYEGKKYIWFVISNMDEKCELLAGMERKERVDFVCDLNVKEQSKIWSYFDSIDFLSWWRWWLRSHRYYLELWHQHLNWEERLTLWERLPWNDQIKLWNVIASKPYEKNIIDWSCRIDLWEHLDWNERINFWKRLNNHDIEMAKDLKEHLSEEQRMALKEKMQDFYGTLKKWHSKKYIEL